jgi:membrane protein YqaA with SNARE-associated domain
VGLSLAIAAGWGFAEATVFFIVADVWITYMAVSQGWRPAVAAAFAAAAGAVIGGLLVYWWGAADIAQVRLVHDLLPAISTGLIDDVRVQVVERGLMPMFAGAFTGVPYKLFAAEAGAQGIGIVPFALASFAARLLRFVPMALLAAGVAAMLRRKFSERMILRVFASCWIAFYIIYLLAMDW